MTATPLHRIACNAPACTRVEVVESLHAAAARRALFPSGWRSHRPGGARGYARDYCPEHRELAPNRARPATKEDPHAENPVRR